MNATRDASPTDPTQVPIPQAGVDFYLQGATVTHGVTMAAGASGGVTVAGTGALFDSALVRIGVDGSIISVTSVGSANQVTLQNTTASSITIVPGTRLVLVSARPTVYADAFGVAPIGSFAACDSAGHVQVYLPEGQYDYAVTDPASAVVADVSAVQTLASATNVLTWAHTITAGQTILIVAISWQESTGMESISSVTFNGAAMTAIASSTFTQIFSLNSPDVGSHNVSINFSGSNAKAAVACAIGLSSLHATTPLSNVRAATGPGTTGGVVPAGALATAWAFAVLGVNTVPGTTTVTLNSGLTSLWNQSIGSTGATDRTQAAGAIRKATSGPEITWSISPSRAWSAASFEALPSWYLLATDATTLQSCNPRFGIVATTYTSLQAAINALPNEGGIVHVPSGTYRETNGIIINRGSVTLMGEGSSTVITPADPVNCPIDLLTINGSEVRLVGLRFDGAAAAPNLTSGTSCIVVNGIGVTGRVNLFCSFENVVVTGAARYGIWMRDVLVFTATNCQVNLNKGTGLRIEATSTTGGGSNAIRFYDCSFISNGTIGADIGVNPPVGGLAAITFMGCTFEANAGGGVTPADVGLAVNALGSTRIELLSCYFEGPAVSTSQFVLIGDCGAATVDNCWFNGGDDSNKPLYAARFVNCPFARFSNNAVVNVSSAIVSFDVNCLDCVEMCNRDLDVTGIVRVIADTPRIVGTSQRSLSIPTFLADINRPSPSAVRAGSLIWVVTPDTGNSHLQGSTGSSWIQF